MNYTTDSKNNGFSYAHYFLKGVIIFIAFMTVKSIMSLYNVLITLSSADNMSVWKQVPEWVIYATISVGSLFIYNSVMNFSTLYDRRAMKQFLSEGKEKVTFCEEMKSVLKSREYITETLTALSLTLIATALGGFYEYKKVFINTGAPDVLLNLIPFIGVIIAIPTIGAHAHYEVRRRWHYLDHVGRLDNLYSIIRICAKSFIIFFGYIFVFPFSPIILFAYLSVFGIFGSFFDFYFIVIALTVIICISAVVIGIKALKALSARKKLLKKLSVYAKENGYEMSEVKRPYASLFKPMREASFTLKYGEKIFSCRLIGAWWHKAPLYFISDKHAFYRHRFGTNQHHIDLLGEFQYDFEGEGQKILLLNPVPKKAYAANNSQYIEHSWYGDDSRMAGVQAAGGSKFQDSSRLKRKSDGSVKMLEPGDSIWGYTLYNTTSFLGAVDRKCLGRTNGMFE